MIEGLAPADDDGRSAARREMRAARRRIPAALRIAAANGVAAQLLALPFAPVTGRVAGYWAVDGEIALHAWQLALPPGVEYCLPLLHADRQLRFAAWRPGIPVVPNAHGIPEPVVETSDLLEPGMMDLIAVPLVAFDLRCHRLGMGGGWYDRTFGSRRDGMPRLVGVGFAAQQRDDLHTNHWDVAMDAICTEERTFVPA